MKSSPETGTERSDIFKELACLALGNEKCLSVFFRASRILHGAALKATRVHILTCNDAIIVVK